jgi:hypothetical protein
MFNLLPKDEKFYDELEQLSSRVVSAAKQFEEIVARFPNFDGQLANIEQDRLGARKIFKESILRFDQAFVVAWIVTFPGAALIGAAGYALAHFAIQPFIR